MYIYSSSNRRRRGNNHSWRKRDAVTSKMGTQTGGGNPADGRLRPVMTDWRRLNTQAVTADTASVRQDRKWTPLIHPAKCPFQNHNRPPRGFCFSEIPKELGLSLFSKTEHLHGNFVVCLTKFFLG